MVLQTWTPVCWVSLGPPGFCDSVALLTPLVAGILGASGSHWLLLTTVPSKEAQPCRSHPHLSSVPEMLEAVERHTILITSFFRSYNPCDRIPIAASLKIKHADCL